MLKYDTRQEGTTLAASSISVWLAQYQRKVLAYALVVMSLILIIPRLNPHPRAGRDSLGHFSYLPALFSGRPFDLREFAAGKRPIFYESYREHGPTVNPWGIGPAIAWLPFYAVARLYVPNAQVDSKPFWLACALGTVFLTILGVYWLYLALVLHFKAWVACITAGAALVCTPLIYYSSRSPFFSHAYAFALTSLLIWCVITKPKDSPGLWFSMGVICGLLADARPQLVVCLALPLLVRRFNLHQVLLLAAGIFLAFSPQSLMWRMTFGHWLLLPQATINPHFFHTPAILSVLISPRHGLFLWHPIFFLGIMGLASLIHHHTLGRMAVIALVVFIIQALLNGAAYDWWGGSSFGGRRFVESIPLLALGVAAVLEKFPRAFFFVVALGWWNITLMWAFARVEPGAVSAAVPPESALTVDGVLYITRHLL